MPGAQEQGEYITANDIQQRYGLTRSQVYHYLQQFVVRRGNSKKRYVLASTVEKFFAENPELLTPEGRLKARNVSYIYNSKLNPKRNDVKRVLQLWEEHGIEALAEIWQELKCVCGETIAKDFYTSDTFPACLYDSLIKAGYMQPYEYDLNTQTGKRRLDELTEWERFINTPQVVDEYIS